jgi:hypothetical protein
MTTSTITPHTRSTSADASRSYVRGDGPAPADIGSSAWQNTAHATPPTETTSPNAPVLSSGGEPPNSMATEWAA